MTSSLSLKNTFIILPILLSGGFALAEAVLSDTDGQTINGKTEKGAIVKLKEGDVVTNGTQIQLKPGQNVTLSLDTGMDVSVSEGSDLRVTEDQGISFIDLFYGELRTFMSESQEKQIPPERKMYIRTPAAVVGVRGTDFFVDTDRTIMNLYMMEGSVDFGATVADVEGGKSLGFTAGESLQKFGRGMQPRKTSFNKDDFLKRVQARRAKFFALKSKAVAKRKAVQSRLQQIREKRLERREKARNRRKNR